MGSVVVLAQRARPRLSVV